MKRREIALLALLTLVVTVPFLGKAFHIDDTFVLHISELILTDPLDPFAGQFDWFGHELSVWEATTNPPLVSYYLAPFAWLSGYSETILHGAMVLFYALLAIGTFMLARRFTKAPGWITAFVMLSPAVVVSGNVMRDIPGAALATLAAALYIRGVDAGDGRSKAAGAIAGGLAVLAKYSMGVLLPVLALYPVIRGRKWKDVGWLFLSGAVVLAWCLHTLLIYGQVHPWYLFLERSADSGFVWEDKFQGAFLIIGSSLFLVPALLWEAGRRRLWSCLAVVAVASGFVAVHGYFYYKGSMDGQFYLWVLLGGMLVAFTAWGSREDSESRDALFLFLWVAATFIFSVKLVPFQAVRHLILLLPPMLIILFRFLGQRKGNVLPRTILGILLAVQCGVAFLVQSADYEYAEAYRDFAQTYVQPETDGSTWYVGHWGWKFYADRAGWRQLHRDGPAPRTGDFLVWPQRVHIGDVFSEKNDLRDRLQLVSSSPVPARIPIKTMSTEGRASFYAVVRGRLPYRFEFSVPLEVINVYKVRPSTMETGQER